jgi:hypothetical protein
MTRNKKRLRNGESCWLVGSPHRSEDGGSVDIGAECQSAFASKLAHSWIGYIRRNRSAIRPPSLASQLQVHPQNQVGY